VNPSQTIQQPPTWPRDDAAHPRERCASCGDGFGSSKVVRLFGGRAYHELCWWGLEPPPLGEAEQLWAKCWPVRKSAADAYLTARKLLPNPLIDDLVRILPIHLPEDDHPSWAWWWRPWTVDGFRLVVPVYDAQGRMRLLRGWRWQPVPDLPSGWSQPAKRMAPKGVSGRGLVMANPKGLQLLRGELPQAGCWEPWRQPDDPPELLPGHPPIVVLEGEPDWLSGARTWPDWCVLGIYSGSWTPEIAARMPDGAEVYVWTDPDEAGDRYLSQIADSLRGRCKVWRAAA
jgi:hypothetical protein